MKLKAPPKTVDTAGTSGVSTDQTASKASSAAQSAQVPPSAGTITDSTTQAQVRPAGTFAPSAAQLKAGGNVLQHRTTTPKRRGRGRTGALRQISRAVLVSQTKKATVRGPLRRVLTMRPRLNQLVNKFGD